MKKLPRPVVCECGFSTIDADEAVKHIKEKHPECWKDEDKYREETKDV